MKEDLKKLNEALDNRFAEIEPGLKSEEVDAIKTEMAAVTA